MPARASDAVLRLLRDRPLADEPGPRSVRAFVAAPCAVAATVAAGVLRPAPPAAPAAREVA